MWSTIIFLALFAGAARAINLKISASGGNISSPLMYGLMFEDINHSGDGGIYAELIQNRAFQGSIEYPSTLKPWKAVGSARLALQNTSIPVSSALPTSVLVTPSANSTGKIGVSNPGWWGISVKPQKYTGTFWALGNYTGNFTVRLQSALSNQTFVSLDIPSRCTSGKWVEHSYTLQPTVAAPNSDNTFVLEYDSSGGAINFNMVSLFPPTYKDAPNGMRVELMEGLKALNPSFLRIPGGNNIEGDKYHIPWAWNKTLGPNINRPGRPGTWGYANTDGLGLIEYMNWCRDLEVEPLLAVWSGLYLVEKDYLNASALTPYVQDTLNELEFLLGPASSTYGSQRAALGYPTPFKISYLEIGNEDNLYSGGASYASYRFNMFSNAIHPLYPNLTIVSSSQDLSAVGDGSATDYHIYTRPDDFVRQFAFFDHWPRQPQHKVFCGEYANVQYNLASQPAAGTNWSAPKLDYPIWAGAVAESVWAIGMERNADLVIGMSYAPGFQNLNSYEWTPDLVSFTADPGQTVKSTSYRAIELFSNARYDATVPVKVQGVGGFGPAYWVAGISGSGMYTFKAAIYNATSPIPFNISFEGVKAGQKGELTVLNAPDGLSSNKLIDGKVVEVVEKKIIELISGKEGNFEFELANYDLAVFKT